MYVCMTADKTTPQFDSNDYNIYSLTIFLTIITSDRWLLEMFVIYACFSVQSTEQV